LDYLRERGYRQLLGRVRHERRHAALVYLAALRGDFRRLLLFARVIASLSPEVQVAHEFQRLRLMLQFSWRFELIRIRLFCNAAAVAQLASLGEMVSALNIRLEAGEIASSLDRRGLDGVS
jgi:hypothetical protein